MITTIIHLTGGLGNQLFQIAAALSQSETGLCKVETALGKPRLSKSGNPEVFSFELPNHLVEFKVRSRFSNFISRAIGYGVRQSVYEKRTKIQEMHVLLASFGIRMVLIFFSGVFKSVYISSGIGYSQKALEQRSKYLIGYFQSHIFADKAASKLRSITVPEKGEQLKELTLLSGEEKPLVVHYRFGDYLTEKNFGIPNSDYYSQGIQLLWNSGKYKKIWVFSDDLQMARNVLPSHLTQFTRWISEVDNSSAATLEAMRHGRAYVIANSTFSWWGAFLSYEQSAPVVAPTPWFQFGESPRDILPSQWIKIEAFDKAISK